MSKKITGTAHITLPRFVFDAIYKISTVADWKRHPWRIRTEELLYKNERFGPVTPPEINEALLKDIEENGIKHPLLVIRAFNGRPYVWLGNQRLAIARKLGIEWVSIIEIESEEDIQAAMDTYKES